MKRRDFLQAGIATFAIGATSGLAPAGAQTKMVLKASDVHPLGYPTVEAIQRMGELLRLHDAPPVCLHEGRMVTVSSSIVWLAADEARYLHVEGRPCERPFVDHTDLLTPTIH